MNINSLSKNDQLRVIKKYNELNHEYWHCRGLRTAVFKGSTHPLLKRFLVLLTMIATPVLWFGAFFLAGLAYNLVKQFRNHNSLSEILAYLITLVLCLLFDFFVWPILVKSLREKIWNWEIIGKKKKEWLQECKSNEIDAYKRRCKLIREYSIPSLLTEERHVLSTWKAQYSTGSESTKFINAQLEATEYVYNYMLKHNCTLAYALDVYDGQLELAREGELRRDREANNADKKRRLEAEERRRSRQLDEIAENTRIQKEIAKEIYDRNYLHR